MVYASIMLDRELLRNKKMRLPYRWEGGLFLGYYASYTCYLLLAASQHALLQPFSVFMLYFVIPLTGITLVIVLRRRVRAQRQASAVAVGDASAIADAPLDSTPPTT